MVEVLPGFDDCSSEGDADWMSLTRMSATLAPGESLTVTVSMAAEGAQPGTYTASVRIAEDTRYRLDPVEVTMTVTPPDTWGKITGTVSGVDCLGDEAPLADTTVHLSTWVWRN